jgi:hypothetical protein
MTNTEMMWTIAVLIAAAILLLFAIATSTRRHARVHAVELQQRFGPEYDRAVRQYGSPALAERELTARERRVERIRIRELNEADRARFAATWDRIQQQFVDDPAGATVSANELIKEVMRARGYPADDFDQRVADLSVDHATVVQHYRAARALTTPSGNGEISTEDLRQALVHYRALFADLLRDSQSPSSRLRELHA